MQRFEVLPVLRLQRLTSLEEPPMKQRKMLPVTQLKLLPSTTQLSQRLVISIAEGSVLGLFAVAQIVVAGLLHLESDGLLFNLELSHLVGS